MSDDDPIVISLNEMWVKVGIGGSAVWTFILFIISDQGLTLLKSPFSFRPLPWQKLHHNDDSLGLILAGWVVIWLLSFLFLRKKPTN